MATTRNANRAPARPVSRWHDDGARLAAGVALAVGCMGPGGAQPTQPTQPPQSPQSPQSSQSASAAAPAAARAPATVVQGTLVPPGTQRSAPARTAVPAIGCLISPNRSADIGSPVTGIIESIAVDVGDSVRHGQVLVTLRSEVESAGERAAQARWRVDAEVRAAEASLELARQRYARSSELLAQGFLSPLAVEQSLTELRVAEQKLAQGNSQRDVLATDLEVVRAQVSQRVVRAPFAGTIVERFRQPGERVEDRPLLRLVSLDPLRVDLLVPASRFGHYTAGDRLQLQPELAGVRPVAAEITHVDRVIDAASNTFRVRLSLPNPQQRLPAGARCTVDEAPLARDASPARPSARAPAPATSAPPSAAQAPSPRAAKAPSPSEAQAPSPSAAQAPTVAPAALPSAPPGQRPVG
jgi:cobalt-zinc-cadmium efflux system membrane fusion protein